VERLQKQVEGPRSWEGGAELWIELGQGQNVTLTDRDI
jgi:hypothetical protein